MHTGTPWKQRCCKQNSLQTYPSFFRCSTCSSLPSWHESRNRIFSSSSFVTCSLISSCHEKLFSCLRERDATSNLAVGININISRKERRRRKKIRRKLISMQRIAGEMSRSNARTCVRVLIYIFLGQNCRWIFSRQHTHIHTHTFIPASDIWCCLIPKFPANCIRKGSGDSDFWSNCPKFNPLTLDPHLEIRGTQRGAIFVRGGGKNRSK